MRKIEYPCVSTSAVRWCVWACMYYRLKGGKERTCHTGTHSAKWQNERSDCVNQTEAWVIMAESATVAVEGSRMLK